MRRYTALWNIWAQKSLNEANYRVTVSHSKHLLKNIYIHWHWHRFVYWVKGIYSSYTEKPPEWPTERTCSNQEERRRDKTPAHAINVPSLTTSVSESPLADLTGGHTCSGRRGPCSKRPRRPHGRCAQEVHKVPCYSHKTQNLHC